MGSVINILISGEAVLAEALGANRGILMVAGDDEHIQVALLRCN